MLYFPRTLALVVGLAGPAAGFASVKGGTMFEVSTETAGPNFKRPNLKCCLDPNGDLPEGCGKTRGRIDECVPDNICERIGTVKGFVPGGTIQEGGDWCNAAVSKLVGNEAKKEACSGGKILRKQKNVMTKNGPGVEFLPCSWDPTTDRCVLAGWSLSCAVNEANGVPNGCPGVTPVGDGRTGSDIIVATKCANKMEKSSLSVNENGSPRYTKVWSCDQKLLDCGGNGGVKDNGGDVDAKCNTQGGVTWDDCCQGDRRFRELEEEDQKQTAQADEKRKSRKLQAATPEEACETPGSKLYEMKNKNGEPDGKCCDNSASTSGGTLINVLGGEILFKEVSITAFLVGMVETCEYKPSSEGDKCECTSGQGVAGEGENCQKGNTLRPWG